MALSTFVVCGALLGNRWAPRWPLPLLAVVGAIGASSALHFAELGGGGIMGIGPYEAFLALDWLGPLKRVHTLGRLNAAGVDSFALIHTEHQHGMAQLHTDLDLLSQPAIHL